MAELTCKILVLGAGEASNVLSLTKDKSVLQLTEEMPELVFLENCVSVFKVFCCGSSAASASQGLNWGFLCDSTERDGSQGDGSDSCPGRNSSDSPLLGIGLVSLGLVPMGFGGYKSTS